MPRRKIPRIHRCPVCGGEYTARGNQVYCSEECRQASETERKKKQAEEAAAKPRKKSRQTYGRRICGYCGEEYTAHNGNQVYCCEECARRAVYERRYYKKAAASKTPPRTGGFSDVTAQIVARCMAYDKMTISEIALLLNWDKDCLKREIRVNKNLVAPWRQVFEKEREERMKYKRKMNARRKSHV